MINQVFRFKYRIFGGVTRNLPENDFFSGILFAGKKSFLAAFLQQSQFPGSIIAFSRKLYSSASVLNRGSHPPEWNHARSEYFRGESASA